MYVFLFVTEEMSDAWDKNNSSKNFTQLCERWHLSGRQVWSVLLCFTYKKPFILKTKNVVDANTAKKDWRWYGSKYESKTVANISHSKSKQTSFTQECEDNPLSVLRWIDSWLFKEWIREVKNKLERLRRSWIAV